MDYIKRRVIKRLLTYIQEQSLSQRGFCRKYAMNHSTLRKMLTESQAIKTSTIIQIAESMGIDAYILCSPLQDESMVDDIIADDCGA